MMNTSNNDKKNDSSIRGGHGKPPAAETVMTPPSPNSTSNCVLLSPNDNDNAMLECQPGHGGLFTTDDASRNVFEMPMSTNHAPAPSLVDEEAAAAKTVPSLVNETALIGAKIKKNKNRYGLMESSLYKQIWGACKPKGDNVDT